MANNEVLRQEDDAGSQISSSSSHGQALNFAENKFVWVAVEALPSSDGVHVLRGCTDRPESPCFPVEEQDATEPSTAPPRPIPEANGPESLIKAGGSPSVASTGKVTEVCSDSAAAGEGHTATPSEHGDDPVLHAPGQVTSTQPAGLAVAASLERRGEADAETRRRQGEGVPGAEVSRDQDWAGDREGSTAADSVYSAPASGPGCDRTAVPERLPASNASTLTAGQSSNASTLVADAAIPPSTSDDSGEGADDTDDSDEGEAAGAGTAGDGKKQTDGDRYSNYFEANMDLLDTGGYDSLDGFQLNVSPTPEPEYAVPNRGRARASSATASETQDGCLSLKSEEHDDDDVFESPPPPLPPVLKSPARRRRDPIYEDIEPASPSSRVRSLGEEIYHAISDAVRPEPGRWDDSAIYEDVDQDRPPVRRQLSSDSSWSEEFESMSEPEPEDHPPTPDTNFSGIKYLLRRKRRTQTKPKKNGSVSGSTDAVAPPARSHVLAERKSSLDKRPVASRRDSDDGEGRLSRWFSLRKSSHYDISERTRSLAKLSSVTEDAEAAALLFHRRHQPPALPPAPVGLTSEQLKRRHIVQSIVQSENNYVASLQSLVNEYKKVLEEAHPPMLNSAKISIIFKRLPEILQCHTLFRIALAESVRLWDAEEKIGDVFVASFSKGIVLDTYSDFINNFSLSMETIKQEAKRKNAFADFLKMRQIGCADRLSLFGLMVKPVQRFPQFILLLQDLLKHTPHGHHDRMSLQLALTQLESLAEMLNERKRESEQFKAFRETLRRLNGKFSTRSLADTNRYLLREDNVTRLEFGSNGSITKSKNRRLFLLNDLVVCVSVAGRAADDASPAERLTLKWSVPVTDVEIQEASTSLTLSHVITATSRPPTGARSGEDGATELNNVGHLCHQMSNLMHDYEVVSRIGALVGTLRGEYQGMTTALTQEISATIQRSIRQKDEEIAWLDACCLQLTVRKGAREEHFTFQLESPAKKREWTTDFRLAQLALDGNNSPAWDVPEREQRLITRLPLFVKTVPVTSPAAAGASTDVQCGCFYSVTIVKPTQRTRQQSYLWICTTDGTNSYIVIYAMQQVGFRDVLRLELPGERVTAMEYVAGEWTETGGRPGCVWLCTSSQTDSRLVQYSAQDPEHCQRLGCTMLSSPARRLVPLADTVWAALESGCLVGYERGADGGWLSTEPTLLPLGPGPVSCLLPIAGSLYAGCGRKVSVIDALTREVTKSFTVQEHETSGDVHLLAHSGVGLWISLADSSTICLYHTETFRHLQDINVASNISRVAGEEARQSVSVTALVAARGLLWVGTSVGATLTIPLPRLEGVPIISGRGNISYHAHCGAVTLLQVLSAVPPGGGVPPASQRQSVIHEEAASPAAGLLEKRRSDTSLSDSKKSVRIQPRFSSPSLLRKRSRDRDHMARRLSKTLPRGMGGVLSASGSVCDDVYGLYGDLLNLHGFEEGRDLSELGEHVRRSDPELAGMPHRLASLDRRLQTRQGRPRSLDLSCWSVDSRCSVQTTSSSSEGDRAHSAPTSRVQSFRTAEEPSRRRNEEPARSVLTVMAGRGYVNWGRRQRRHPAAAPEANSRDAHLVLWEMKL